MKREEMIRPRKTGNMSSGSDTVQSSRKVAML